MITDSSSITVAITLDDGDTWSELNNGVEINGLITFTICVEDNSQLNYRISNAATQKTVSVVVTAA